MGNTFTVPMALGLRSWRDQLSQNNGGKKTPMGSRTLWHWTSGELLKTLIPMHVLEYKNTSPSMATPHAG